MWQQGRESGKGNGGVDGRSLGGGAACNIYCTGRKIERTGGVESATILYILIRGDPYDP